jgi:hypothetical protein
MKVSSTGLCNTNEFPVNYESLLIYIAYERITIVPQDRSRKHFLNLNVLKISNFPHTLFHLVISLVQTSCVLSINQQINPS